MKTDDTIVIKAPAGTKARWVHLAQIQRMKLSDWIRQQVEIAQRQKNG